MYYINLLYYAVLIYSISICVEKSDKKYKYEGFLRISLIPPEAVDSERFQT